MLLCYYYYEYVLSCIIIIISIIIIIITIIIIIIISRQRADGLPRGEQLLRGLWSRTNGVQRTRRESEHNLQAGAKWNLLREMCVIYVCMYVCTWTLKNQLLFMKELMTKYCKHIWYADLVADK